MEEVTASVCCGRGKNWTKGGEQKLKLMFPIFSFYFSQMLVKSLQRTFEKGIPLPKMGMIWKILSHSIYASHISWVKSQCTFNIHDFGRGAVLDGTHTGSLGAKKMEQKWNTRWEAISALSPSGICCRLQRCLFHFK